MFARLIRWPVGLFIVGAAVVLSHADYVRSQQVGNKQHDEEFNKPTSYQQRLKLFNGERPPTGAADEKLMEATAIWYIGRTTWASHTGNPAEMAKLHESLDRILLQPLLAPAAAKRNRVFVEQLGTHLAKTFKAVFARDLNDKDNRVANINAALMLPPVAKLKQEAIGDLLVELINDPKQHDAVKLYAVKSMGEFFPARINDDPKDANFKRKFERDSRRLAALVTFIDRKGPLPSDEGELEAIRYMRREAIMSLAHVGVPALAAKKGAGVEGPAAYELLRVLVKGKGAYEPPTSLSERVEAALGLCHLKDPAGDIDYDPSVAVYAVGLCFLDFATAYSQDYVNLTARKDKKENSKIPALHWRILSERFKLGAKELLASTAKGTPARAHAQSLEKEISRIAASMSNYVAVQGDLIAFRNLVKTMAPKSGLLYKLKGPQVDPASLQGEPADGT